MSRAFDALHAECQRQSQSVHRQSEYGDALQAQILREELDIAWARFLAEFWLPEQEVHGGKIVVLQNKNRNSPAGYENNAPFQGVIPDVKQRVSGCAASRVGKACQASQEER